MRFLTIVGLVTILASAIYFERHAYAADNPIAYPPDDPQINWQPLNYKIDGMTFEGGIASSKSISGQVPGVMLIHNWFGLTRETVYQARRIAALGYVVFAVDVYGKGVRAADRSDAVVRGTHFKGDREEYRSRLQAALEVMRTLPHVDSQKIAAVGHNFGGTGAIELARTGANILGAIDIHGVFNTRSVDDGVKIKAKMLIINCKDDPTVHPDDKVNIQNEFNKAHLDWKFHDLTDCVGDFTNRTAGLVVKEGEAFNSQADQRSFQILTDFLHNLFK